MAGLRFFDFHRRWEDYAGIILGLLIGLSPWLTGGQVKLLATGNAVAVGVTVFAFAAFELVDLNRSRRGRRDRIGSVANRVSIPVKLCQQPTCHMGFRARRSRRPSGSTGTLARLVTH